MTKLKCWKKGLKQYPKAKNSWTKKDGKTTVHVNKFMGHYDVFALHERNGGVHPEQIKMPDTKKQGIKFANKYMKSHDKC